MKLRTSIFIFFFPLFFSGNVENDFPAEKPVENVDRAIKMMNEVNQQLIELNQLLKNEMD